MADARTHRELLRESLAGILAVIRTPSVGRLFVMNLVGYSSFALMVGLWGGPYLTHVYGYDLERRGSLLLIPVLAQIVGSMAWGPMRPPVRQLQAAGPARLGPDRCRARLARAVRNAPAGRTGRLVCGVRLLRRLRRGADRARPGAVSAASGRPGPHASQYRVDGRRRFWPRPSAGSSSGCSLRPRMAAIC